MPEVPRVKLPHPVAGTGEDKMAEVASDITPSIVELLSCLLYTSDAADDLL